MIQYPKNMIVLQTHNNALMWSRFERIGAIMGCLLLVVAFEFIIAILSGSPTKFFASGIAAVIAQLLVLKCWWDLMAKRQPGKNCWEFERKTK